MSLPNPQSESTATPKVPKIKHDWYQTETHVVVSVYLQDASSNDIKVTYESRSISVTSPIHGSTAIYNLELNLLYDIVPEQCSHHVMASKLEIKLKKLQGLRWTNLERQIENPVVYKTPELPALSAITTEYPSSCLKKKDWDKLETELKKEEAEEKPEGEEALKRMFSQIYSQSSDEVRMAMNKSYFESDGTVLSTNWNEVSKEKVKIQPPDGTDHKKWDS